MGSRIISYTHTCLLLTFNTCDMTAFCSYNRRFGAAMSRTSDRRPIPGSNSNKCSPLSLEQMVNPAFPVGLKKKKRWLNNMNLEARNGIKL